MFGNCPGGIGGAVVPLQRLAQVADQGVLGRGADGAGPVELLSPSANGQILKRTSGVVGFGALNSTDWAPLLQGLLTWNQYYSVAFDGLAACLNGRNESPQSFVINVLGDSTGNDATDWVYLWGQALATTYSATHRVVYSLFNNSTKDYAAEIVLNAGPSGEAGIISNGSGSSSIAQFPIGSFESIPTATDIDVRVKLSMVDWTPSVRTIVIGQYEGVSLSWALGVNTNGTLFLWATDGTTTHTATNSTVAPTVADGAPIWIRAVCDIDNGASGSNFLYYTSSDGVTWTQLGTTVTRPTALTRISNATTGIRFSGRGSAEGCNGTLFRFELRAGIDGYILTPYTVAEMVLTGATWTGSPTVRIVNGSVAGWNIANVLAADTVNRAIVRGAKGMTIVNLGHNQQIQGGQSFLSSTNSLGSVSQLLTAIRAVRPTPISWMVQNPQTSASSGADAHRLRAFDLENYAPSNNFSIVDIRRVFLANPNWVSEWMADSVHPNAAGSAAWAAEVTRILNCAIAMDGARNGQIL